MAAKDAAKHYDSAGQLVPQTFDEATNTWSVVSTASPVPVRESFTIIEPAPFVAVTAVSKELIPANPARKYLLFMVIGTVSVTISTGVADAVDGIGLVLQGGGEKMQGGSQEFSHGAPTNSFQVVAGSTGSSVIVWEGI